MLVKELAIIIIHKYNYTDSVVLCQCKVFLVKQMSYKHGYAAHCKNKAYENYKYCPAFCEIICCYFLFVLSKRN